MDATLTRSTGRVVHRRQKPHFQRTPIVPQMEMQDCGAACLTSILRSYGLQTALHEVRMTCGASRNGTTAAALVRAATAYGLTARARRIGDVTKAAVLNELHGPAVALLKHAHFVVLDGVKRGMIRLNDPASGRRSMTPEQFAEEFSGILVHLEPGSMFSAERSAPTWMIDLANRCREIRGALVLSAVLSVITAVPALAVAAIFRVFLEHVIVGGQRWALNLSLLLVLAAVAAGIGAWLQQRVLARALVALTLQSSKDFLWKLMRLPGTFFSNRQLGGLVTRVQFNDGIANLVTQRLAIAVGSALTVLVNAAVLLWISPVLAIVPIVAALLSVLAMQSAARQRGALQHRLTTEQYQRDALAFSGVSSIESMKESGTERAFFENLIELQARCIRTAQEVVSKSRLANITPSAIATLAGAGVVLVAWPRLQNGSLGLGEFLAFQLLVGVFFAPLQRLVGVVDDLQIGQAQLAMLADVTETPTDPYLAPVLSTEVLEVPRLGGAIAFEHVSFGYDRNQPPLIADLSLVVEAGQCVAFVGASGAGKSTIARLLAGVLAPWEGSVTYDGLRRQDIPRNVLTTSIGYVDQQQRHFQGSVRDNVTLWDPTMAIDDVEAALQHVALDRVVAQRGGIDDEWIAEDARNLSGGERQRLELARVLALEPSILILDEATSALDAETERLVHDHFQAMRCTRIVFAHRLSSVRNADRILVLEAGRVVQDGAHEALIAVEGPYRQLHEVLT